MQVDERFGIDEDADFAVVENTVALTGLRVEADIVAQPGTPAALHAEAHAALFGRDAFFGERDANFGQGFVGDLYAFGRWLRGFGRVVGRCGHEIAKLLAGRFRVLPPCRTERDKDGAPEFTYETKS